MLDRIPDQRVLRGSAVTFSWQFTDADGEPAAPVDAVTIGIVHDDGTAVIDPGTATDGAASAPRTYSLSAGNNDRLDLLTATWTDDDGNEATTLVEVSGAVYFTVAEARASDATLADDEKYPTELIVATRREVEEEFEQICGMAFVPRYARETLNGSGRNTLVLGRSAVRTVRSIEAFTSGVGETWTDDDLAEVVLQSYGQITSRVGKWFTPGDMNLVVCYEHGLDRPPAEVKRAALQRLRSRMNMALSAIPSRATTYSATEGGTYALATASATKTGDPDVDGVLARYMRRTAGIA